MKLFTHAGAVHNSSESQDRFVGVIIDAEIILIRAREGNMHNVVGRGIEDIDSRNKVDILLG
jgi:hypothetical protein